MKHVRNSWGNGRRTSDGASIRSSACLETALTPSSRDGAECPFRGSHVAGDSKRSQILKTVIENKIREFV